MWRSPTRLAIHGLRAEREQRITIDVAYRYFATPKRKFIIADTPGHGRYTRNMVTGASTADLAVILIDARAGVVTQSRRHGFIASLLGIQHLVVAVNKMDLVDWSQERYEDIVADYTSFSEKLDIHDITFIPISALLGDNIVTRSEPMSWYQRPTLLEHLETVSVAADRNLVDFRFPVQYVIRADQDFRGYSGAIVSGTIRPGTEVTVLPSGEQSRIASVHRYDQEVEEAFAGQAAVVTLEDDIDISRGDMIVRRQNLPVASTSFEAVLCWMDDQQPLIPSSRLLLRHTSRTVPAFIDHIRHQIDVETLHHQEADGLRLNEIGSVNINTAAPVFFDSYQSNHATGAFVLVDPGTNGTVAAGMIRHERRTVQAVLPGEDGHHQVSSNVAWEQATVIREQREERNGHRAAVVWLTGLSGSGKSTIARALEAELFASGRQVTVLDGDNVRHGLCGDLGFGEADRHENLRRVGHAAKLLFDAGQIVIGAFVSPFQRDRDSIRGLFPVGRFLEVYVRCSLEVCEARDPKGLYEKVRKGEIAEFTGISSPYEVPARPALVADTEIKNAADIVVEILSQMPSFGAVPQRAGAE